MFTAEPWVTLFTNVFGKNPEEGINCLKAFASPVKAASGLLFGGSAARHLEAVLRESATASGMTDNTTEYAIRYICLLAERRCFRRIDTIIAMIEKRLDDEKNILEVTAETAAPIDSTFETELEKKICERTGAAGIKMDTKVVPELLAGYRLRIGGFYIDASLKRQMEKLKSDLTGVLHPTEC